MSSKKIYVVAVFAACATATLQARASADDWAGWYLGGNLGYGWGNSTTKTSTVFSPTGYFAATSVSAIDGSGENKINSNGWTGGVTGGHNWQFDRILLGVEAELGAMRLKGSHSSTATYPCCAPTRFTINQTAKGDNLFMLRGRIGYVDGRSLYYLTAGAAATEVKVQESFSDNFAAAAQSGSSKSTKTSYAVGGGYEYRFQNDWTAKIEYLHFDFGGTSGTSSNLSAATPPGAFPANIFTNSANLRADVVRFGMNYRF